ncbi:MAG TPA: carboxypeptidase regulatory-like domain-containing protein [Thermoanaerobaculia bacterium]|nr:carboxypeptidase regulatory-like domain-containing protein [Thermoanaerobaculia bacterium]
MRSIKAALLLLLLAALAGPGAWAQTTTSSIGGVVRDDSGPLAGATVEAVGRESGFRQTTTTEANGRFALPGLQPGVYTLTVSSSTYSPQGRTVQVLIGQDVDVELVLSPTEVFTENVTVVGDTVQLLVETRSSEIATNITPRQIESLPQNNRNFLGLAILAPGVRFTEDQDAAGQKFRSGGSDARQVNVFIDGLSYKNDILPGGGFMQESSRGNPFPQNAVQEFRVLTQNFKAEYEKASAAVITAVTKSGGNDFNGDIFYLTQDNDLVAQDDFSRERGDEKPDYEREQIGLSLGGPIVRDRLHFFLSYEGQEQDRNAGVFRGGSFDSAPANVQQFLSGFETGVLTSPFESDLYFGKLSWQPAVGQTLYTTFHRRDEQEVRGFGGQRTRDGAESFEIGTDAFVAKHTWVIGNALNEASGTVQTQEWSPAALDSSTPRLNYIGILDVGGKDATQDFKQDRIGLRDDVSWALDWRGAHSFKSGVSVNWLDYAVSKNTFENALFEFRSDEDWQFPFQARIGFGDPELAFSNTQAGLYLQDDWQVFNNLTLNLGVRWDYESNMINNDYRTPPELVAAMEDACRTYGQPVGGQTTWCLRDFLDIDRFTTDGDDRDPYYGMVQPRVGFAWDVRGNAKTVVFGGWGRYYDRVVLNDIFDEQYRQQYKIFSFCFSADGSPTPNCSVPALAWRDEFLSAEALRQLVASGQAPGPEVFLVDNEMRPPRSNQWSLGVRHQLGNWLTSLSYSGVRGYNNMMYFFADLPPGTQFDDRFGNNVQVPGFARLFYTSTSRRTWYDGFFLNLDRPITADGRWGFNLSYTYAEAEQTGTDNPGEGIAFGAFDYLNPDSLFRIPGTNDERHRLIMSGTVALPANFQLSSIITLGSGVPFTVFDDSTAPFTVRWNEGRPEKHDFIIPDAWAYRSTDLRLEWQAPPIVNTRVSLIAEGFNIFNHDNGGCFESSRPRLPDVNERFGQPNCQINTRRFQGGVRVGF